MSELSQLHELIKDKNEDLNEPASGTQFYLKTFKEYETFSRFASWNWGAFFFGSIWLIYRKSYLYGFLILLLVGIAPLGFKTNSLNMISYDLDQFIGAVLLGIFGNAIYRHDLRKRLKNNSSRKGTNLFLALLMLILYLALYTYIFRSEIMGM